MGMIAIERDQCKDDRGQVINVGDQIVRLHRPTPEYDYRGTLTLNAPTLVVSTIKELRWDPHSGFAQAGPVLELLTDDGQRFVGDGENGWGRAFYRLPLAASTPS
jgi:hypothetical protein